LGGIFATNFVGMTNSIVETGFNVIRVLFPTQILHEYNPGIELKKLLMKSE
jgi:hypothetical protein